MKRFKKAMLMPWAGGAGPSSLLISLISYWNLDEVSGARADSVGGNTLTDNNTVTQNPGKVAGAAQFTAANSESLSCASNASLQTGDIDFTIAGWMYIDSLGVNRTLAGKTGGTQASDEFILDYSPSLAHFRFVIGGTAYVTVTPSDVGIPSLATWYFLVGWHDSVANTVNIQVNGGAVTSVSTGVNTPLAGAGAFRLGVYNTAPFMDGRIDETGFWKRVLTAGERAAAFNSGNGVTYPFLGS